MKRNETNQIEWNRNKTIHAAFAFGFFLFTFGYFFSVLSNLFGRLHN